MNLYCCRVHNNVHVNNARAISSLWKEHVKQSFATKNQPKSKTLLTTVLEGQGVQMELWEQFIYESVRIGLYAAEVQARLQKSGDMPNSCCKMPCLQVRVLTADIKDLKQQAEANARTTNH